MINIVCNCLHGIWIHNSVWAGSGSETLSSPRIRFCNYVRTGSRSTTPFGPESDLDINLNMIRNSVRT